MVEEVSLRKSIVKLDVPAVVAFGNPLLDIYVTLKNDDLLKKYNLSADGEMELPAEKMQELLADLPLELISIFVNNYYMQYNIYILHKHLIFVLIVLKLEYEYNLYVHVKNVKVTMFTV